MKGVIQQGVITKDARLERGLPLHAPNVRVRNVKEANIPATKPMNWQPRTITTALVCETPSVNVTCNGNSEQLGRLERGLQSSRHS
ncbi:hypothetical protein VFPFJ_09854 [Purpureocillium lilacinum]|uniref:Uncharacterized protein n=1 Tax=Purpureocillium lilacinum TaxID=33203 RepID=A0A179GPF4_PURLI|nr:hypothetical protein VFPFJ_09854 [Purpureocillium lilacinum]OAQ79368.1 hypothetical protein VFPFJ_09854 [Purpureocillium lilacinum]